LLLLHFSSSLISLPCSVSYFSLVLPPSASRSPYLPTPFISFISSSTSSASPPTTGNFSEFFVLLHLPPPSFLPSSSEC
jgi:hypothetical protein